MICSQCQMRNPIGNKFCRECGGKLAAPENALAAEEAARADSERKHERVAGLLTQAFRLNEERKWAEALPLAEQASEILPESTSALGLLATLHERLGQHDKAIAAMEKVVELNPESAADRATLERLRRGIHLPPTQHIVSTRKESESALPWVPLIAAGGVMAILLGVGFSLVNRANSMAPRTPGTPATTAQIPTPNPANPLSPSLPTMVMPPMATGGAKISLPPPGDARQDPFDRQSPLNMRADERQAAARRPRRTASSGGGTGGDSTPAMSLPIPSDVKPTPGNTGMVPPVTFSPPRPITGQTMPNVGATVSPGSVSGGSFGSGGRLSVGPPPITETTTNSGNESETHTSNGGYIRIKVGEPKKDPTPPPAAQNPAPPAPEAPVPNETTLSRARRLQSQGRYADAIRTYQDALSFGMDGPEMAEAHQAIAQCYDRLGNPEAARSQYQDAIRAYEARISAGRNIGDARQGIVTCRAALEAIGGGSSNL